MLLVLLRHSANSKRTVVMNVTIGEELDQFRRSFPECVIVSLADLSTGMVLAASTRSEQPQEVLDALCGEAVRAIARGDTALVARLFGASDSATPTTRILISSDDLRCFVAAEPPHQEALCMVFDSEVALISATIAATEFLSSLESDT